MLRTISFKAREGVEVFFPANSLATAKKLSVALKAEKSFATISCKTKLAQEFLELTAMKSIQFVSQTGSILIFFSPDQMTPWLKFGTVARFRATYLLEFS